MFKNQCEKGMPVVFKHKDYIITGIVVKTNAKNAQVKMTHSIGDEYKLGSVWNVPYALLTPTDNADIARCDLLPHIQIGQLLLDEHVEKETFNQREDHNYTGSIVINDKRLNIKLHLWRDPHFTTKNPDSWLVCLDVNANGNQIHNCEKCCESNTGKGDTAQALGNYFRPLLKTMGYANVYEWDKGGYFFTFDMFLDECGEATRSNSRRMFHHKESRQVTCPVHGKFKQVTTEVSI